MSAPSVSSLAATQATRLFSHYHSSDKTITIEGSERRILLKDTSTTLKMTSENVPLQICKSPFKMCSAGNSSSVNVRVNLRLKICG